MNADNDFKFRFGGHRAHRRIALDAPFEVFTEDCFSGKLTSKTGKPRKVAPYPRVNPLAGPFHIEGVRKGNIVAIHIQSMTPARDWGVSTLSPNFGLLSGTRMAPNLQPYRSKRVWIWSLDDDHTTLRTEATNGTEMSVPFTPFFGTIGVAPAHSEVRLSVVPGDFGGNLDLPELCPGSTLYLRANVDGAHLYLGDGHYAQGDGEIVGTAVEGAFNSSVAVTIASDDETFDFPRIETQTSIGVVGVGRPLDNAIKVAAAEMVRWLALLTGLDPQDAHQLVSQVGKLRVGNLVNPECTVLLSIPKTNLPKGTVVMGRPVSTAEKI